MSSLTDLQERIIKFRDARNWDQFHTLRNLIISLNVEAAELLELVQWKDDAEAEKEQLEEAFKQRLAEEASDVLIYLILMANRAGIDLLQAAYAKIEQNEQKYPVEKAYGSAKKYDQL